MLAGGGEGGAVEERIERLRVRQRAQIFVLLALLCHCEVDGQRQLHLVDSLVLVSVFELLVVPLKLCESNVMMVIFDASSEK